MVEVPYQIGWGTPTPWWGYPTTWSAVHPTPWRGYPTTWGGVHPSQWWRYLSLWGGVFLNLMVRGKGVLAVLFTLPWSKKQSHTNLVFTYRLKLVMSPTGSHILNELLITCKLHNNESLLFIELTSQKIIEVWVRKTHF